MAKFKKGDRVKYTGKSRDFVSNDHVGKTGTVESFWRNYPDVNFDDGTYQAGCYAENLELIAEATGTSKFKVGDRVRFIRDNGDSGARYGRKGDDATIVSVYSADVGGSDVCVKLDVDHAAVGFNPSAYSSDLEHVAVATQQQLRIQAGRFYKTRDGRKVGPMRDDDAPGYMSTDVNGVCRSFKVDGGEHWESGLCLIAEWPPEPASNDNEPQSKFKVGDSVRCNNSVDGEFTAGNIYTVASLGEYSLGVVEDDSGNSNGWGYDKFELATTNPAIVCLLENGQPLPSTRPFVHANADAASGEAARLSHKYPGKEFGVYELVSTAKVEPVYDHEWQRLAAEGLDESAACELAALTGLPWEAAHHAVFAYQRAA